MISSKVDLTEHNDFGGQIESIFDVLYDPDILTRLNRGDFFNVSSEEYDKIWKQEKFFGVKQHADESGIIFNNNHRLNIKSDINITYETHCARCGRVLIPWKSKHGLCSQCDEEYSISDRCPWKIEQYEGEPDGINDAREIFNLR